MNFGIAIFPTDYSIAPTDLAEGLVERGFESMWVAGMPSEERDPALSRLDAMAELF